MALRETRPPGVYRQRVEAAEGPITLGQTGVPAILGLATRGPLETPVCVRTYSEFSTIFGKPVPGSYLNEAVYGFFSNGGETCYVVRIAHKRGKEGEVAKKASFTALDRAGNPTLLIEAANEGSWGNQIEAEIKIPDATVQTYLTFDVKEGDTKAVVKTARGFERGTLVRIYDGTREHYVTLTDVDSKVLRWGSVSPSPERFKSSDLTYIEPVEFDVFLREGGKREVFRSLSLAPGSERYPGRIVDKMSELIRITVVESEAPIAQRLPAAVGPVSLAGGLDGLSGVTPEDFIGMNEGPGYRCGLAALEENEEVDLIAVPDLVFCAEKSTGFKRKRDVEVVQEAVLSQCDRLKDRFAILDIPRNTNVDDAIAWRLRFDSNFGAFYYPWIGVPTKEGNRLIPPSCHIAGVYARCDSESGPHQAPANEIIQGAVFLQHRLEDEDIGYLNSYGVNPIRTVPSRGIRIWGARTVSSQPEWKFISVRRVVNALRRSIVAGTQWTVFESNDQRLWSKVERHLKSFFQELFERGYFAGKTPQDAFYVKCDEENNTPERREAGELITDIGVAPVRPAEYITFTLMQQLPENA